VAVTGDSLAVDLSRLAVVGSVALPEIGYVYARLNGEVAGTASGDLDAFMGGATPKGYGGATGSMYTKWSGLRDELQNVLGNAANGLQEAGHAVMSIVQTYLNSDGRAKASFDQKWLHGPPPDQVPGAEDQLPTTAPPVVLTR